MKSVTSIVLLSSFALAACGTPATVATPAPGPAPSRAPVVTRAGTAPTIVPPVTLAEAPKDWQLLDESTDHIPGISAARAMNEVLAGKTPKRAVLVAIIDGGIDTAQVDLKANLWSNPKEIAGNGKDDDNNGFVDDVHGWDFIGGKDSQDVNFDTFEVTREYARCHGKDAASGAPPITDAERCKQVDDAFAKQRKETEGTVDNINGAYQVMKQIVPMLQRAVGGDSLTLARVRALKPSDPQLVRAQSIYIQLVSQGATLEALSDQLETFQDQLKYNLNPDFNPRGTVGDNYTDLSEHHYGNSDVMGPDASHGTHVAGIIGALRGNGVGIDGIATSVRFMMIRTVPNGDERDKDVGNAIRYAVDNGAQIISMSFGKPFSPFKSAVDDAVRYADSKGVLMVHAAGNDGEDLAKSKNFPTPVYLDGGHPTHWIEVGASSWKGGDELAAPFSNYGKNEVDVFAPGVDILSSVPGNKFQRMSGTSMAAPVVSGLAALIMEYYPNLSSAEVKQIILQSVAKHTTQQVNRPGEGSEKISFGSLSATGGIVNAYNALKLAEQMSATKTRP